MMDCNLLIIISSSSLKYLSKLLFVFVNELIYFEKILLIQALITPEEKREDSVC